MTASTGRTLAFAILIFAFLVLAVRLTPLILAPLGIFPGMARVFRDTVPDGHFFPHWLAGWGIPAAVLSLTFLVLWIAVLVWVYRDAERRRMNGALWALLVFFGNLIGLIIYLIVRSDHPLPEASPASAPASSVPPGSAPPVSARPASAKATPETCPSCDKPVSVGHTFCPHCGAALRTVCPACAKPVEKDWKACPYCGKKL
jgi:predicted RNA-binding Zn-ribbon protein involved in translation (DUF1610 family)